ncbi:MAG: hypothetical protein UHX92_01120 [Acutalibacteraceae bacterium]|nr:hypothetical protein [Acutalibacteraceae bacterium]
MQAIKGLIHRIVPELDGMFDFEIIKEMLNKYRSSVLADSTEKGELPIQFLKGLE